MNNSADLGRNIFALFGVSEIGKHLCKVWGNPKFGNIFALFGVSEIRKHRCTLLGVYEIRKLFFSLLGCFQISGKTFDLSSTIFGFRVIGEFLILVFILNLRLRENKENPILCKGGVLEIRAKFTFNFLPKFNLFRKKNLILPCLNQLVGQRLPISSQKYTIFLAITIRKLKTQQRRSTATERLSVWVKPRKGMLRNKTNKPRRLRKEIDTRSSEIF